MATAAQSHPGYTKEAAATRLGRSAWDRLISGAGAVVAVVMLALGGAAIYGGSFALDNVRDRLEPQQINFPAAEAMTPEETAEVGDFAGAFVDTGTEAEAYSRYIGIHLGEIGGGKTYAELGGVQFGLEDQIAAAEEAGDTALVKELEGELAGVTGQRDTIFKGETLRAILLNAYGWWTVGQITFWAGIGAAAAGLVLAVFAALGFRHARRAAAQAS
ncbi:MAG TPA: hypothetical protein VG318_13945 [Actinomycetota bacterium]|nr:hypothetical protein [Actinomycetota bacterium]